MSRRLLTHVHVLGDDGQYHVYGPDDDVPDEHAKLIGDHAWVSGAAAEREPGEVPPMSGKGSGVNVWRAYAAEQGVTVDDDASRDDIVAALRDAGRPVE